MPFLFSSMEYPSPQCAHNNRAGQAWQALTMESLRTSGHTAEADWQVPQAVGELGSRHHRVVVVGVGHGATSARTGIRASSIAGVVGVVFLQHQHTHSRSPCIYTLGGQPPSLTKPLPFTLWLLRREGVCEGGDPLHTPYPSPVKGVTLGVKPPPFTLKGEPRSLCCGPPVLTGMPLTNSNHI
jgi:hypothetical protein